MLRPDKLDLQNRLSRRTLLRSAVGASIAGLLVACGGDSDDSGEDANATTTQAQDQPENAEPTSTTSPEAEPTATGGDGEGASDTREVVDVFGDPITVPVNPQRVILIGPNVVFNAALLGFPKEQIVGILWGSPEVHELDVLTDYSYLEDIPNLGDWGEPDLEEIISLNPDLIVSFGFLDNQYFAEMRETYLRAEIPLFTAYNGYATVDDTMLFLHDVGVALNLEDRATEEEENFRAAVESVGAQLPDDLPSVSTIRPFADGTFWANSSPLLNELEVPGPRPTVEEPTVEYSGERLRDVDADYVLVYGAIDTPPDEARAMMEENPVWDMLSAVQDDRVYYVEPLGWLQWHVPALYVGLEEVEAILVGPESEGSGSADSGTRALDSA